MSFARIEDKTGLTNMPDLFIPPKKVDPGNHAEAYRRLYKITVEFHFQFPFLLVFINTFVCQS